MKQLENILSMKLLIAVLTAYLAILMGLSPDNIYIEELKMLWLALVFGKGVQHTTLMSPTPISATVEPIKQLEDIKDESVDELLNEFFFNK